MRMSHHMQRVGPVTTTTCVVVVVTRLAHCLSIVVVHKVYLERRRVNFLTPGYGWAMGQQQLSGVSGQVFGVEIVAASQM